MATPTPRLSFGRSGDPALTVVAVAGAATSVVLTIGLAAGELGGRGLTALGVVVFTVVVIWCFVHRNIGDSLALLLIYLGLLDGYLKLRTGSSIITLARDVLVAAIAAGALLRATRARQRLTVPPLAGLVAAFVGLVLVELANPSSPGLTGGLAGVRQHLEFVPLFFLGYAFVRTESQIRRGLLLLAFCAALGGVVSYVQSRLTPGQLAAWGPGYAQRILGTGAFSGGGRVGFIGQRATVRPFGLGSDAGSGASLAALALPGLVALLMTARPRVRATIAPLALGIGLAVVTSGSRAAIVTTFASLLAFGLVAAASKNALKAVVGLAVSLAIVYGVFAQIGSGNAAVQRSSSISATNALSTFSSERGSSVLAFGGLATNNPFGVGVGTVGPATVVRASGTGLIYNSETEWNFLVVETGIAGVVIYLSFLLRVLWLSVTRIRRLPDSSQRLYLAAIAAPIFAILVAGFSGPTSASVPMAPYFWLGSGVLAHWLITTYCDPSP